MPDGQISRTLRQARVVKIFVLTEIRLRRSLRLVPARSEGRSRVVTSAGRDAVDAGCVGADVMKQGEQRIEPTLVSASQAVSYERRDLRTAKPCGPGCRCYSQAAAKMHSARPVSGASSIRRREGGQKELGSRESAA